MSTQGSALPRVDDEPAADAHAAARTQVPAQRKVDAPFVWPPRKARPEPTEPPVPAGVPGEPPDSSASSTSDSESIWRAWLAEAERVLLGVRVPPMRERFKLAGWKPDDFRSYCWRCGESLLEPTNAASLDARPATGPAGASARSAHGKAQRIDDRGCSQCRSVALPWDRFVRLGTYRQPLKSMIRQIKFTSWRRLGAQLGAVLGHRLADAIAADVRAGAIGPNAAARIVIVPVAASPWHRLSRGIDHTMVLARGATQALRERGHDARVAAVLARRHRPAQTSVRPSQREANVAGSVRASRLGAWRLARALRDVPLDAPALPPGVLIVVLDDVRTTGATMRASCREVRRMISRLPPAQRPRGKRSEEGRSKSGEILTSELSGAGQSTSLQAVEHQPGGIPISSWCLEWLFHRGRSKAQRRREPTVQLWAVVAACATGDNPVLDAQLQSRQMFTGLEPRAPPIDSGAGGRGGDNSTRIDSRSLDCPGGGTTILPASTENVVAGHRPVGRPPGPNAP